jgi:isoleucyl-tRNA synthetase
MFDFKELEERILKFWDDHSIFQKSIDQRKDGQPFVFFEGPPTANAAPAIHHFIGRAFKDVIPRYQTMRGRYVLRKGGWDTHGLPVELQVEKALGFKNKKDIEHYGIAAFNRQCRQSVWQNKEEWDRFTRRIGYWVDLDEPYITYENPYIESLWHIISQFDQRKLLYQAHRVVPFCTRCGTPLSSHEVAQGYQTVTDTSAYVRFRVKSSKLKLPKGTSILAWTTTPWTLPGNVALAVGADIRYVLAKKGDEHYILAADLADKVLGAPLAIEREFTGAQLAGISYEPLFAVKALKKPKAYKVYPADFVTTTDGTGIVHIATMYGEDDYDLGKKVGLPTVHTVTEQGTFIGVSKELDGIYAKSSAAEKVILDHLTASRALFAASPYEHEYPSCWRCGTPLLYYAKDSWFIRMSALNAQLIANNQTVNWVPEHLKDGRFGQWLREGKDWAFSRERYWGTPLPIWRSKDGKQSMVVSSLDDLDKYRAKKGNTYLLVRHGESQKNVDDIIDSGGGKSDLTDHGKEQARQAAQTLKKSLGRSKPIIIASPLPRAKQTAQIIADALKAKVVVDDRLTEIQLGPTLDGCHDSKYHEMFPTYRDKFLQRPPGGESLSDLRTRMWTVLADLEGRYDGKTILLVCHEYPIWMLADAANGWSMEQSIAEQKRRGDSFIAFAGVEKTKVRNLPRDERGGVDLHRPYIDDIVLKKAGKILHRVPELCDVWFDSGAMPFAQWHWPFEQADTFAQQFPADFICEAIDQTRGWFYTLLAVSTALGMGAPYRAVLSYSHVLDEKGQKMSKSKGNIVKPDDVIDAVGVDTVRWYFYTINNPGDSKMFSMKEVRERLTGFMATLQNCLRFWELYKGQNPAGHVHEFTEPTHLLDQWVLSRLNGLIGTVTGRLDSYDLTGSARAIEQFVVDDFSQWWLRRSRKRSDALALLGHILRQVALLAAPFIPFTAEDMWQRLKNGNEPASIHLADWPVASGAADERLEQQMARVREFISAGLAIRKQEGIRVRQPLASFTVPLAEPLHQDLIELIRDELNVKNVITQKDAPIALDLHIGTELRAEGFARELMRAVQDMRKEIGLEMGDKAHGQWHSEDAEISQAIQAHADMIMRETGLTALVNRPDDATLTIEKNFDLAPGKSIWIGIRK